MFEFVDAKLCLMVVFIGTQFGKFASHYKKIKNLLLSNGNKQVQPHVDLFAAFHFT